MFKKEKKDKKSKQEKSSRENKNQPTQWKQLIVFDGDALHDWVAVFRDTVLPDGSSIRVIQASWIEVELTHYHDGGPLLTVAPVRETLGEITRPNTLTVKPDFVIIRNQPRGPTPDSDRRNVLYGLMMSGVPSCNSLLSEYCQLERPIMFGALEEIKRRVGKDKFPLIPQNYYSTHRMMVIQDQFPAVIKIGHAHRGMGKLRAKDNDEFRDISTVVALHSDYCTAEPFIDSEYGLRVQKVGKAYRVYKKIYTGSGWKSQFGGADLQEIELEEKYKIWADECSKCFGGLDWFAVDALHGKDGQDYIIELNGAAIGFQAHRWEEDTLALKAHVLEKMFNLWPKKETKVETKEEK